MVKFAGIVSGCAARFGKNEAAVFSPAFGAAR